MQATPAPALSQEFIPLALEEEDIAVYASIAAALDCNTEICAEAFMLATPAARDTAVRLWQAVQVLNAPREAALGLRTQWQLQAQQALQAMRALLGLDPERMPTAALAAAGLRYSA